MCVLSYQPNKSGNRRWYVGKGGCGKPRPSTRHECDEYPFFKTREGGPRNFPILVSLDWVPRKENRSIGGHFGVLARTMKSPKNRDFVVITSDSLPSVALPLGRGNRR